MSVDVDDEPEDEYDMSDGPESLCGGSVWDIYGENQQLEAYQHAVQASCELGFEKVEYILVIFGKILMIWGIFMS